MWGVGEDDEHLGAGGGGALEEFVAQFVFGGVVELEPQLAFGEFGDGLDGGRADGAEDEGDVVSVGGLGEHLTGLGPHEALEADGSDAEGGVVGFAEELGLEIGALVVADVVGAQLDLADVGGVAVEIDLGVAATLEVFEGKFRHALACLFAEVLDGGEFGVEILGHDWTGTG